MNKALSKQQNEQGAALLIFVIVFLIASTILVLGIGRGVYTDLAEYRVLASGKQSFYAAEAGIEDAVYRHRDGKSYSNSESLTLAGATVAITRTLVVDSYKFVAEGDLANAIRQSEMWLTVGDGASFNFGLQSGNGGIRMFNSSSVIGNVFSNGPVQGSGNTVRGDVISAGSAGIVNSINATGSVWARTITGSTVGKEAYYQSIVGTNVSGSPCVNVHCHPGSADQATATMPISDQLIEDWKTGIETTGTIISSTSTQCSSGMYKIDSDTALNNIKIECDVEISKNTTDITIAGPVWIEGTLFFVNGPTVIASSSLGAKSVQIIVDDESNRTTGSKINVQGSTNFASGNAQSFVVLISMNNSAELGGSNFAIELANLGTGKVLLYAPHGLINLQNNISLKEVTAYKIATYNSAQVVYESGLMNLLFTSGPGGGFTITSWNEVE